MPTSSSDLALSPAFSGADLQGADAISMPRRGSLYLHQWTHPDPIGKVIWLHGKGDYGYGFAELGRDLQAAGWSCYAPDMFGFGRSPGRRCWMWGFDQVLRDLETVQRQLSPQIWGGYSTGAIWAMEYALAHPQQVQGLVLISPALRIDNNLTPLSQRLLPYLNQVVPQWVVIRRYRPTRVTSVPYRRQELIEDPYVNGTTRIRFVAELIKGGRRCRQHAHRLTMPILVLYTPNDRIVNPEGTEEVITTLRDYGKAVTVQAFPNSEHDLLHDVDHLQVKQGIRDWLEQLDLPAS